MTEPAGIESAMTTTDPPAEPARLFRLVTTAPDGSVAAQLVDREELDWAYPALLFLTDHTGWSVTAEPEESSR
jgi:hypothetical protein